MSSSGYIGRFAPSPSGPLHLGSLMSATCSYLQAKSQQGKWLVRIEDIDTPRVVKGAADKQLWQLEHYGFEWDDQIIYQSTRINHYKDIIQQLQKNNLIYACECSRKQLKSNAQSSAIGNIYPKTCRHKQLPFKNHALRLKTPLNDTCFIDSIYGKQKNNIQKLSSDWIIQRADGVIAYHLAVVLDDALQEISEVVRGFDILPLSFLHIELQKQLQLKTPRYFHHPLIMHHAKKLSKQNHAPPINETHVFNTLNRVLEALGQNKISDSQNLNDFWTQAIQQWDKRLIPTKNINI